MPGGDAGGGESRVKTFCKNLFHKRCCSPRARERLGVFGVYQGWLAVAGLGGGHSASSSSPLYCLVPMRDHSAGVLVGMGGELMTWEREFIRQNTACIHAQARAHTHTNNINLERSSYQITSIAWITSLFGIYTLCLSFFSSKSVRIL